MIKKGLVLFFYFTIFPSFFGCALYGPTYKKPNVNVLKKWKSPDQLSRIENVNLPMLAWWKKFEDKELTELIEKAVDNNNNVQSAIGNVIAAQGELLQIQFSWLPSLNALLFGYASKSVDLFVPGYNSGFIPTYALNLFQFMRSTEWAKAKLAVANAAKDAVILTVISQTVAGYFTYSGQSYLLQQQKQLVADLQELLALSKKQYHQGLISLYTLQQYEQQYEKANAEQPIIANNVVLARNALRLLLNENPGEIGIKYNFINLKSNGIIPMNLPSQVLNNRPDVRNSEQQLVAANANVGMVTSTFFPTISLTNVVGSGTQDLGRLFSSGNDHWNNLSLLTMPMFDPEFSGQYKSAKGLLYAAYRNYIQTVRVAFKSVDDDLSAHQQYYDSLVAQKKNFSSSKTAFNLAEMSYKKGLYSYPTLLVNKVNMDRATIDLTKSKLAQLLTIVQLYQDLGGGYAYKSVVKS